MVVLCFALLLFVCLLPLCYLCLWSFVCSFADIFLCLFVIFCHLASRSFKDRKRRSAARARNLKQLLSHKRRAEANKKKLEAKKQKDEAAQKTKAETASKKVEAKSKTDADKEEAKKKAEEKQRKQEERQRNRKWGSCPRFNLALCPRVSSRDGHVLLGCNGYRRGTPDRCHYTRLMPLARVDELPNRRLGYIAPH